MGKEVILFASPLISCSNLVLVLAVFGSVQWI